MSARRSAGLLVGLALAAAAAQLPLATSDASFTAQTVNVGSTVAAAPDWVPPTVTMAHPGPVLRGTVVLGATAEDPGGTGVRDVRFERAAGPGTWAPAAVATAAPYAAGFDTRTVPDGTIQLRAVATDHAGYVAATPAVDATVDNRPVRGIDVQAFNGGWLGRFDAGDVLELTYSHELQPGTVVAGWSGTARPVVVRVQPGIFSTDELTVFTDHTLGVQVPVGSVDLRASYVSTLRGSTLAHATMTATPTTVEGRPATTIRIVVGQRFQGGDTLLPVLGRHQLRWSPHTGPLDVHGIGIDPADVLESGPSDRDF